MLIEYRIILCEKWKILKKIFLKMFKNTMKRLSEILLQSENIFNIINFSSVNDT